MMENGITLNIPEFRTALREYMEYTKKDLADVLNTKGYHIANVAVTETKKVTVEEIDQDLMRTLGVSNLKRKTIKSAITFAGGGVAPSVALIINSLRGRMGLPGLYGQAMTDAINKIVKKRHSSSGNFAAGWIGARERLRQLAYGDKGSPPTDRNVKVKGIPKGTAIPAIPSWSPSVELINSALSKTDTTHALSRYAGEGFEKAVRHEIASMYQHIQDKLQKRADEYAGRN